MITLLVNEKKLVEYNEDIKEFIKKYPEYANTMGPINSIDDVFMPYSNVMSQTTTEQKAKYKMVLDNPSLGFDGFYVVLDSNDHYEIPRLTDYEVDNSLYDYGIADNASQIIKNCKLPENSVVLMCPVFKDTEEPCSGWRWHKWGPYYGVQKPTCEYINDEPDIEMVFSFKVVTLKKMVSVRICDIKWDTDGEDNSALPTEIEQTFSECDDLEEVISDWLSDEYGYCHNGFTFEIKEKEE